MFCYLCCVVGTLYGISSCLSLSSSENLYVTVDHCKAIVSPPNLWQSQNLHPLHKEPDQRQHDRGEFPLTKQLKGFHHPWTSLLGISDTSICTVGGNTMTLGIKQSFYRIDHPTSVRNTSEALSLGRNHSSHDFSHAN